MTLPRAEGDGSGATGQSAYDVGRAFGAIETRLDEHERQLTALRGEVRALKDAHLIMRTDLTDGMGAVHRHVDTRVAEATAALQAAMAPLAEYVAEQRGSEQQKKHAAEARDRKMTQIANGVVYILLGLLLFNSEPLVQDLIVGTFTRTVVRDMAVRGGFDVLLALGVGAVIWRQRESAARPPSP